MVFKRRNKTRLIKTVKFGLRFLLKAKKEIKLNPARIRIFSGCPVLIFT